jgi:predicted SAM-dependent methyltransferase
MASSRMLNIGCGSVFHPEWENIDVAPFNSQVRKLDVTKGLPYGDGAFDVVYASHVLEHLAPHTTGLFLNEIQRVLSLGGIFRAVVPDLEGIVRAYLRALDGRRKATAGEKEQLRHQWMIIELIDQMVREYPDGGEMIRFLLRNGEEGFRIAEERFGYEISHAPIADGSQTKKEWMLEAARSPWFSDQQIFQRRLSSPAHETAEFRRKGEIHLWMYDALSLGDLLREYGFTEDRVLHAAQSGITDFATYNLDTLSDGTPRKPDSLYMEARKSESSSH